MAIMEKASPPPPQSSSSPSPPLYSRNITTQTPSFVLDAHTLKKREERRQRRACAGLVDSNGNSGGADGLEGSGGGEEEGEAQQIWEHHYDFNGFSVKVMEEFASDACVGGTQWPGNRDWIHNQSQRAID